MRTSVDNTIIGGDQFMNVDNMSTLLCEDNFNLTIFTYGYSGSGKTYTLFGEHGIVFQLLDLINKKNTTVTLESVKLLYGTLELSREKTTQQENETTTKTSVNKSSGKPKQENETILTKTRVEWKLKLSDTIQIVNTTNLTSPTELNEIIEDIMIKNNKQALYDIVAKALENQTTAANTITNLKKEFYDFGYNVPSSTYDIQAEKDKIYNELFPPMSTNYKDLFIKSTPNNPNSSRGFLFFSFKISKQGKENKLVIVDMAGNEDPYDILVKTLPTYSIPRQGAKGTFLSSVNIADIDFVASEAKKYIVDKIVNVLINTENTVKYFGNPAAKDANLILSYSLGYTNTKNKTTLQKFNHDDKITLFPLLQYLSQEEFTENDITFMKENYKFKMFQDVTHALNFSIFELAVTLVKHIYANIKSQVDVTPYISYIYNIKLNEFNEFNKLEEPIQFSKTKVGTFLVNVCNSIISKRKSNLSFIQQENIYFYSPSLGNIVCQQNEALTDALCIYCLNKEVLKGKGYSDIIPTTYDIHFEEYFLQKDYDILNTSRNTVTELLSYHKKINATIDHIYFDKYQANRDSQYLESIKYISVWRYLLEYAILHVNDTNLNIKYSDLPEPVLTFKLGDMGRPFKFDRNKFDRNYTNHENNHANLRNEVNDNINNLTLNKMFENRKIKVIRHEEDGGYSIIESKAKYFYTIVMEGFYINQVNYELMQYLLNRKNGKDTQVPDNLANRVNKERLTADTYTANQHIGETPETPMTKLYTTIDSLIGLNNTNNKFFMLANIRPDHKYRQGALNTLELVSKLKST